MPPGGAAGRAEALATVSRLAQERFIDDEVGKLLEELRGLEESSDFDSFEASLIRKTRRDYEKAQRVSPELVGEIRRAAASGSPPGARRSRSPISTQLLPHLEQQLELRHRYIDSFPQAEETYDILLDDYEPLMKTSEVREVFDELKQELVPLIQEIGEAGEIDDSFLSGEFDPETQRELGLEIVRAFGYSDEEWRLDETAHPFMTSPGAGDIRLTSNFRPHDLSSLFGDDARVRARRVRVGRRPVVRTHAARDRRLARAYTSRRAGPGRISSVEADRSGAGSIRGSSPHSTRSSGRSMRRRSIGR